MTPTASTILDELCQIDPTLRAHEKELLPLIEQLLRHRPDVMPDPAFVAQLRHMLVERAENIQSRPRNIASLFTMTTFASAIAGAFFGIVVAVPITMLFLSRPPVPAGPGLEEGKSVDGSTAPTFLQMEASSVPSSFAPVPEDKQGPAAPAENDRGAPAPVSEGSLEKDGSAPATAPAPSALFMQERKGYRSDRLGVAFGYPAQWFVWESDRAQSGSIIMFDIGVPASREAIRVERAEGRTAEAMVETFDPAVILSVSDMDIGSERGKRVDTKEDGMIVVFVTHGELLYRFETRGPLLDAGVIASVRFLR